MVWQNWKMQIINQRYKMIHFFNLKPKKMNPVLIYVLLSLFIIRIPKSDELKSSFNENNLMYGCFLRTLSAVF